MPTTFLKNPVRMDAGPTQVSLSVTGTPAAATADSGAQPPATLVVEGTPGQETTGAAKTAGSGANVSICAGRGGAAPAASENGPGGTVTINPGPPGDGGGSAASFGNVLLATAGGNVGIGTASPQSSLHVNGNPPLILQRPGSGRWDLGITNAIVGSTGGDMFWEATGTSQGFGVRTRNGSGGQITGFVVDRDGKVGIGTSGPQSSLHVYGNPPLILERPGSGRWDLGITNAISGSTGGDMFWEATGTSQGFGVRTRNGSGGQVTGFVVDRDGKFGIGTLAPGSKLHVDGGVQVGAPTGGDKGTGTINISGDIYKNGTPLLAKLEKAYAQILDLTKRLDRLEAAGRKPTKAKAAKSKTAKAKKPIKSAKGRR